MSDSKIESASAGKMQIKQEAMKTGMALHGFLPSCFNNFAPAQ
ncbi:MAG: hypothetical protein NTV08_01435 [Verrucomicrobia bacterium]|jgi:hypothetical protein|nr:hypothetical protein [Verrucomicrobiota bacterium]